MNHIKKLSILEIKSKLEKINPNIEILSDEYVDANHKIKCGCLICKCEWFVTWSALSREQGCPECYRLSLMIDNTAVHNTLLEYGLSWIGGDYEGVNKKTLQCLDDQGFKYLVVLANVKSGQGLRIVDKSNPFSSENIKLWLYKNNRDIIYMESDYKGSSYKHEWKCKKCNSEFNATWTSVYGGHNCPYCCNAPKKINNLNSIRTKSPNIIKYLKNKNDADKYSPNTSIKISTKCPECGYEKAIEIRKLNNRGFTCAMCSDNISIPEKFLLNLLQCLYINPKREYSKPWSCGKRYDFYFELNNKKYIIETHGEQHYKNHVKGSKFKRTLQEEQDNDLLKHNLAIENEIKPENYIVIDCRKSELDWLRENCIKSLSLHFDLSTIDWTYIWDKCQKSAVRSVCDYWNNKQVHETTLDIAKAFGYSRSTITVWLKRGDEIGLCKYDTIQELKKSKTNKTKNNKLTYQYNMDGTFIKRWNSTNEPYQTTRIFNGGISNCCIGKNKTAGGFKWSYNPPNENGMYPD